MAERPDLPAVSGSMPFVHNVDAAPTYWWLIFGELQNSAMNKDAKATKAGIPQVMEELDAYAPAPSLIGENFTAQVK